MKINKNKVKIVIFINFLLISAVYSPFIQTEVFPNNNTIVGDLESGLVNPSLDETTIVKKFDVNENIPSSPNISDLGDGPKSIIGTDGRVRITPTTVSPFKAVCKIKVWWGLDEYMGSGAMVSIKHVLTAAHVIYSIERGGWADRVDVIPAQDNGFWPLGVGYTTFIRTYTAWTENEDEEHDFALLTLDRDIGLTTGAFGIQTADYSDPIYSGELHTAGYPGDRDGGINMYYSNENGNYADYFKHYYYLDTYGGQSGSPVWYEDGYGTYITTVHAYGYSPGEGNSGTRLNQGKIGSILSWINEDLSIPIPLQPNMRDRGLIYASFTPSMLRSSASTFQVACDIQNRGIVETGAYTVSYYASTDTTITTSDYLIGVTVAPSITAKSFGRVSWSGAFPTVPTGNYYIGWIIDASNSVSELREDDNVACYTSTQILVDNDAPSNPTICNQVNGTTLSDQWQNLVNNPNFNWTGASDAHTGVDGYYYYWGTSSIGTSMAFTTGIVYDPPEVNTGTYFLRVQTKDILGNLALWATIYTFKYDISSPNSSLSYTIVQSPDIVTINTEFSITAADIDGSGIFNISYRINDTSWFNYISPFTLSGFSDGYISIDYYATDLTGNFEPINSEIVNLDKDPPSTNIHYIDYGISFINESTVFSFSVDDGTGSGVNNTYYRIDGGPWLPYLTSFTLGGLIDGYHTIDYYSIDYVDNSESRKWEMVYLDLYAPSTGLHYRPESLPNRVNTSTIFEFSDNDGTGSGVRSMFYRVDGEPWINSDGAFNLTGYGPGNHTIEYYSIDNVGNQEGYNNEMVFLIIPEESTTRTTISGYGSLILVPITILTVLAVKFNLKKKLRNNSLNK
jgi:V8-like Glu-specific endopeptidase